MPASIASEVGVKAAPMSSATVDIADVLKADIDASSFEVLVPRPS